MRKEPRRPAIVKRVQPRKLIVTIINTILSCMKEVKKVNKCMQKLDKPVV